MEIHPDFDAGEVARTVGIALSNLHNRSLSSDSGNDETPLVRKKSKAAMSINADTDSEDKKTLISDSSSAWRRFLNRIPARYVLTVLGFLGFCNVYALRVNLSVALVAMLNHTAIAASQPISNKTDPHECEGSKNSSNDLKDGEFIWSGDQQGTILGAFFYGYLVTQIPGGRIAELCGGKWLFGLGVLCTSVLTLLTPIAARWGIKPLIVLRIFEGLGEGVTFPAMHSMLGCWLPKLERSMLSTIIYSGAQIGTVIAMPISGLLCDSDFLGGWQSVFYVFGFLGIVWFVTWSCLIYESPEKHPRISKAELLLIQSGKTEADRCRKNSHVPWKSILTSIPVWTLIITHFGQNWGFYTFLTELPTYLSAILHFDIKSNGFLSALPYLLQAIVSWIVSYVADLMRQRQYLSVSAIRKICNTIGFFGPAICLFGVIFVGCNHVWSVTFLTLAMGFNGCTYSGYMVTHVDMSPDFAGTLMGMTNAFATTAGFLAPTVVGILTTNQTLDQWRSVFYIAISIYFATGTLFILTGSANPQNWDTANVLPGNKEKIEKTSDIEEK